MATPLFTPIKDRVLVDLIDRGERVVGGIIVPDDDFTERGIMPRKAVVVAVGRKAAEEDGLKPGDHVIIGHGDWTRGFMVPFSDGKSRRCWATESSRILTVIE